MSTTLARTPFEDNSINCPATRKITLREINFVILPKKKVHTEKKFPAN